MATNVQAESLLHKIHEIDQNILVPQIFGLPGFTKTVPKALMR